jgi:hypothetical protein
LIDQEVHEIIRAQFGRAKEILEAKRGTIELHRKNRESCKPGWGALMSDNLRGKNRIELKTEKRSLSDQGDRFQKQIEFIGTNLAGE